MFGFTMRYIPFNYLGVSIFEGKTRTHHLYIVWTRVLAKLASWKGYLISMIGSVQLVMSVIHGMILYSLKIYEWPINLLKKLDSSIRKIVWTYNIDNKKTINTSSKVIFSTFSKRGFSLRDIKTIEKVGFLSLCWKLLNVINEWSYMLISIYFRHKISINFIFLLQHGLTLNIHFLLWKNIVYGKLVMKITLIYRVTIGWDVKLKIYT